MTEEKLLAEAFAYYAVKEEHQITIREYLGNLRDRDEATYRHSIRVGVLASRIGEYWAVSGKTLLWAGLLHDIGKILVDPKLLNKNREFTEKDQKDMEPHVEYGCRMLRGIHDWTANIIVRHHRFGKRPYPAELPQMFPPYAAQTNAIFDMYARLLALADYYDAMMHRDNDKHGNEPLSPAEKRERYLCDNDDQRALILELEKAGILDFSA